MTPAELALWLAAVENVDALATLLESGDLRMVSCASGYTVLRTHLNIVTRFEVGSALILPPSWD
jgi:hypothetical protein